MISQTVSTRRTRSGLNRRLSVAGLLVVLAVSGGAARASLFAYDGFDYPLGQTVVGQGGGSGWSGNYTLNAGNNAGAFWEVSDMTASFPELSVSGNQLHLDGSSTPGLS